MQVQPQNEHHWLTNLAGAWEYESDCLMGPDQPPMKVKGSENVRTVGDVWIQCEGTCEMPGEAPTKTVMSLGYDTTCKRFVGTFLGSMMTHLWVYDGELDAEGKILTLNAEGPRFTDPTTTAKYKDMIEIVSPTHRILTSQVLLDSGKWFRFMTAHYHRTK